MEYLGRIFQLCIDFMKTPINVLGYEISFWGIFIFMAVCDIIALMIGGFLSGK